MSKLAEDIISEMENETPDLASSVLKEMEDSNAPSQETLESKYIKPAEPYLKALQNVGEIAALPFTIPLSGLGYLANTASNYIQGKPQEPDIDPLEDPKSFIQTYGTTGALTRTLDAGPEMERPILPQSGTLEGDFLSKQFPTYYPKIKGINQKDLTAMAVDTALAHGATKKIPNKAPVIKPVTLETAADYIRSLATDQQQLLALEKSGKIYELARMVQNDPEAYLHQFRPNKIYENISGKIIPEQGVRDTRTGKLPIAMAEQEKILEGLPQNKYSVPREELQASALSELPGEGMLEAGQRSSAQNYIKENIPVRTPDAQKLASIQAAQEASGSLDDINKILPGERMSLETQIQAKKNAIVQAINEQPDLINNPAFKEQMDWLKSLPVENTATGENIFPKTRVEHTGTITTPPPDWASATTGGKKIPFSSTQEYNPTASPFESAKNKSLLESAITPKEIPNAAKQQMIVDAIEQHSKLSQDLKNLSEQPTTAVNNKKLLKMINEKNKLEGVINENADPSLLAFSEKAELKKVSAVLDEVTKSGDKKSMAQLSRRKNSLERSIKNKKTPDKADYLEYIRSQNEEPVGYATEVRRKGNKLMEPPVPGEISTDVKSKNLAGRAMEKAARKAEADIMGSSDLPQESIDQYHKLNREISNMIQMRDLLQGSLAVDQARQVTGVVPSFFENTGRYISRNFSRYGKTLAQEGASKLYNIPAKIYNGTTGSAPSPAAMGLGINMPNLPMQLVSFQIPRNSQEIMANKDIVLAKIAQMSNDPNIMEMLQDAVVTHPEKLPKILPAIILKFPDLFEPDDYNRVDGKIFDPMMKAKAAKDLENSKLISVREKAAKAKRLAEEGIYE